MMESNNQVFSEDVQKLLTNYLDKNELNDFIGKLGVSGKSKNKSMDAINNFYAQQLKIEYSFAKDRMEIDRTITFAKKNLDKGKYLQLLRKLGQICIGHGKLNLALEVFNSAVRESENQEDKAESLLLLSDVYSRRAEWRKSIEVLVEAKHEFELAGNKSGSARCENLLGAIYGEKGELEEAKTHFEQSLAFINPEKEKEMCASIESNLGIIENIQGNYKKAFEYLNRSLRKFESLGNYRRISELKHNIGMLHANQANHAEAVQEFDQCIEISLREGLMPVLGMAYLSKANVLVALKEFDAAKSFADKAMEICHQIDDKLTMADIYKTKSMIEKNLKNYETAEHFLHSSLRLNVKLKNILNVAETSFELASLCGEMNKMEEREKYLHDALKYYREVMASDRVRQIEEMLTPKIYN